MVVLRMSPQNTLGGPAPDAPDRRFGAAVGKPRSRVKATPKRVGRLQVRGDLGWLDAGAGGTGEVGAMGRLPPNGLAEAVLLRLS